MRACRCKTPGFRLSWVLLLHLDWHAVIELIRNATSRQVGEVAQQHSSGAFPTQEHNAQFHRSCLIFLNWRPSTLCHKQRAERVPAWLP